jgi:D-glycero-alpha-D-manno-heptose-7-phosphate kinase
MIIARSPLQITLGDGGTDLPSYYREHSGFLIAAAIDKYVYVILHEMFLQQMLVRYSQIEWG